MQKKAISEFEFISLMASMMAMAALSIDALLPGLNEIGRAIGVIDPKEHQLLITMIFLGLGFGQLVSGALSDSLGRKPVVYLGYAVFGIASLLCVWASSLEVMILGRLLQGVGLSAFRSVSMAVIRDKFSGDYMARIMSFVSVIFILVPVVAPSFGKAVLDYFGWEYIFYSQLVFGLVVVLWFWMRLPETLVPEHKRAIDRGVFTNGVKVFFKHRTAVVCTLLIGLVSAPFLAYISASQHIFETQYQLGHLYPYIFSGLALTIGLATYLNGMLVVKFGMQRLAIFGMCTLLVLSLTYVLLFYAGPNPSSIVVIAFLSLMLFSVGFILGNVNAMAMQPIGHIAGIGAAIIGCVSTVITVPLAVLIGQFIEETVWPLFLGFTVLATVSLGLMRVYQIQNKQVMRTN